MSEQTRRRGRAARWATSVSFASLLLVGHAGCGGDDPSPYKLSLDDDGAVDSGGPQSPEPRSGDRGGMGNDAGDDVEDPGGAGRSGGAGSTAGADAESGAGGASGAAGEPSAPAGGCEDSPELRVLFIGNSHTFTNDLPTIVRQLSCAAGRKLITQSATPGGVGFVEHAVDPNTLAAITDQTWDFVVMQDQQQRPGHRLPDVEQDQLPALLDLVEAVREARPEAQTVMYMVWARSEGDTHNCEYYPLSCSFETSTRAVSQGYRFYAERSASIVAPVALAWAAVRADTEAPFPGVELWSSDGSHANPTGSYLAAAVIVGTLFEVATQELAFDGGFVPAVAGYLRGMADRIVADERADPYRTIDERVRIECEYGAACSDAADASGVTFTLSTDDCDALGAGDAQVRGRIHTALDCRGACITVGLGAWHDLDGDAIEDDSYQVHAHVDVDGDGELGAGDLEACQEGFAVGGGEDLVFGELDVR
jgi:hypothetical protein